MTVLTSGWCMSVGALQHAGCKVPGCPCWCHESPVLQRETGREWSMMERADKVRKHPAGSDPASLVLPEERSS